MAYTKTNWETAPISIENLNKIENELESLDSSNTTNGQNIASLNEKTTPHILKAFLNADSTATSGQYSPAQILFNKSYNIGNKLSFENSQIKIGSNINHIKISAGLQIRGQNAETYGMDVYYNNQSIYSGFCDILTASYKQFMTFAMPAMIFPAVEGAKVKLCLCKGGTSEAVEIKKYGHGTFIQVEVVD